MKEIVIANLSMDFALKIVNLYKYLINEKNEYVMSRQLLRCGTSIGANIAESEHAQSKADYLAENEAESIQKDLRIIIGTLVNTIKNTKGITTE